MNVQSYSDLVVIVVNEGSNNRTSELTHAHFIAQLDHNNDLTWNPGYALDGAQFSPTLTPHGRAARAAHSKAPSLSMSD